MRPHVFTFENLTVYQRSLHFSRDIFLITQKWPREYLFGLTDQLRRAALSIPLNIAEGYSRTTKDFQHFLLISRGSSFECIPLIQTALQLKLLTEEQYDVLYNELYEIGKMLSGLRSSLKVKS